ncbi:hypothetical protein G7B40_037315 [Aetokthonos hydrillicola Thurmond2011]|jgi:hypothetical protein|uniref:Uncharacterized protein n=1 Tax=Aetokthonos hydrillicola Thurmond2011 TaxID=2712845 RepID=A0AAP5MCC4_9CYAN|nr:hypothetical protein [Aetokthonos hydrillicola]MDR9900170.1 hypothetical protein [Aetokthonos hydrillicola Thurmond2011]
MQHIRNQPHLHKQGRNSINNKQCLLKLLTPLTLAASVVMGGSSAQALQFNFTHAPGKTLNQMLGYEIAGRYWSNYLANDVTLNIFVEPTNKLPTNVIGGAIPGVTSQNSTTVSQRLKTMVASSGVYTWSWNPYWGWLEWLLAKYS